MQSRPFYCNNFQVEPSCTSRLQADVRSCLRSCSKRQVAKDKASAPAEFGSCRKKVRKEMWADQLHSSTSCPSRCIVQLPASCLPADQGPFCSCSPNFAKTPLQQFPPLFSR